MLPELIVCALTLLASLAYFWLTLVSWQKRSHPGVTAFAVMSVINGLWTLVYAVTLLFDLMQPSAPPFDGNLYQAFTGFAPVSYLVVVLTYTYPFRLSQRRRLIAALYVLPALNFVLVLRLFASSGGVATFGMDDWIPVLLGYSYLLMLGGIGLAVRQVMVSSFRSRKKALGLVMMGVMPLVPEIIQWLYYITQGPWPLDMTPAVGGLAALIGARTVFRLNLLDILPVAYERVFASLEDGIVVIDMRERVHACNAAALSLLRLDEPSAVNGMLWQRLPIVSEVRHELKPDAPAVQYRSGSRCLEFMRRALLDESGQDIGSLLTIHDVTERIQAEAQRVELEQALFLRKFMDDISHDFFNSLAVIKTGLYLTERSTDADRRTAHIQSVREQADRLHRMLNDMLLISKLEQDAAAVFRMQTQSVAEVMNQLASEYCDVATRKGVRLQFHPVDASCLVTGDCLHLGQALGNIVDNALAFTCEGGLVTVQAETSGSEVRIDIRDTGCGISADEMPRIFDPFYRGESYRPVTGSVGLGLTIANKIIQAHQGHIEVDSQPGEGSTFHVSLPLAEARVPAIYHENAIS